MMQPRSADVETFAIFLHTRQPTDARLLAVRHLLVRDTRELTTSCVVATMEAKGLDVTNGTISVQKAVRLRHRRRKRTDTILQHRYAHWQLNVLVARLSMVSLTYAAQDGLSKLSPRVTSDITHKTHIFSRAIATQSLHIVRISGVKRSTSHTVIGMHF